MKLSWKKILITFIIVLSVSFGTISLLNKMGYDFKVLSNDSGFDADYGGGYDGGSDYGGGYDSDFDYDYGGSNGSGSGGSLSFEEFIKIAFSFVAVLIPVILSIKAEGYLVLIDKSFLRKFLVFSNGILVFVSGGFGLMLAIVPTTLKLIIYVVTMLPSIITCIVFKNKKITRKIKNVVIPNYTDVSNESIKELNYKNVDELKTEIYNSYVAIQIAWMNNTIEDVRHLLSDEMFNMYKSQLFTLSNKNQQNVMSDFKYINSKIYNIKKTSSGFIIETTLEVICKDYIINTVTQKVLRGSSNLKRNYLYNLKFKIGTKTIDTCPNCHAKLPEQGSSVKCSYCGNIVVRNSNTLVLLDKKMLRQNIAK